MQTSPSAGRLHLSDRIRRLPARFELKTMTFAIVLSYVAIQYPPLRIIWALDKDAMKKAEFYPFSSFPMYSRFSPRPNYVYLSDARDRPVASLTEFGVLSSELKKFYDARLRETRAETNVPLAAMTVDQKRTAGEATLRHVIAHAPGPQDASIAPSHDRLRLHEVVITFGPDGSIAREDLTIAELGAADLIRDAEGGPR